MFASLPLRSGLNIAIVGLLLVGLSVGGRSRADAPAYSAVAQHAGYLGQLSVGGGRHFNERHSLFGLVGRTPLMTSGDVWQVTAKYIYTPWRKNWKTDYSYHPFYTGGFFTYTPDDNFFLVNPDRYPDGYYPSNAYRLGWFFGAEFFYKNVYSGYLEIVTLDSLVTAYYNNLSYLGPEDVFSLALGFKWRYE